MMEIDRRRFLLTGLGAAGGLLLYGCSGDNKASTGATTTIAADVSKPLPRPTLRIPGEAFGFPQPFAYNGGPGYVQMSYLYDTLLWADGSGELLPWLAAKPPVRSPDGMTYTFELRENARWHDGQPVTPEDVAFTFDYFAKQFLSGLVIAQPQEVDKATPTGPRTVDIHLKKPIITFPSQVAGLVPIIPKHIWESVGDPTQEQDTKILVGSGPYKLETFDEESGALLYTANDDYHLGKPFVKRIEIHPVGDELTALQAGEIDGAAAAPQGVTPDALAQFRSNPAFGLLEQRNGFCFPLYFNLKKGGALADVRFRQACARAVDRSDIVKRLLQGNGTPGNPGFVPPDHPFFVKVEQYPFDVAAANKMLDDAGYTRPGPGATRQGPDGKALRFTMLVSNLGPPALAELLVGALKPIGVEVAPQFVDPVRLFGTKGGGDYELAVTAFPGPAGAGPESDPDYLRKILSSNPFSRNLNSVDGYANTEVEDLGEKQRLAANEADRKKLVGQLQEATARDLPVLNLYYSNLDFAFKKSVFDQWAFFPGGSPAASPYNKHQYVTGLRKGLKIRPSTEA
jgi:peptide/nickel transport system substrate-binding protein